MDLGQIKGIKQKRVEQLNSVGIYTPMDLLSYFPSKYVDLRNLTDFNRVKNGDDIVFVAVFREKPKTTYIRKKLCLVRVTFEIESKKVHCSWFNQKFFAGSIQVGKQYYIIGKAKQNGSSFDIVNPKVVLFDKCSDSILTFYKPIKNISSAVLASSIKYVLQGITIHSYCDDYIRSIYGLMPLTDAYKVLHQPKNISDIDNAKRTIAIEYLSYTLSVYRLVRQSAEVVKNQKYGDFCAEIDKFICNLPFELTCDQLKAISDIINDLRLPISMNRLLQGDVGCGKTVVALTAMYYAYLSGYQSVLMCPTELLARQHYATACKFFERLGVRVAFLSSSLSLSERNYVKSLIESGEVDFIIGTHAVFSADIVFKNLSLVITDEQHRFGVNQRSNLENKAIGVDCLVMSATPIPRTLALTLYGDLKQSYIRAVPKNKAEIVTKIVPDYKIEGMWKYFLECAERDERTYVVCPRIDDDDEELTSVKGLYSEKKKLGSNIAFLHGQMSDAEKESVMTDFASGKIKILISTTVIEVGIDVPEAVNIAVYNAERYGLSQLHQLRGRVGRGSTKSYCFLIPKEDCADSALERLCFLSGCSDGFELAEYDFSVRGAGDFLGNAQHGKSGDFMINAENIAVAKAIADKLLESQQVRSEIDRTVSENRYSYFKNITLN